MDPDDLFPERESDIEATLEPAIDEVCARLGRSREFVADDGYERAVVGAAVDGDRLAWVERRSRSDAGGWEDVEYTLYTRAGATALRTWEVETYNPYFGCAVGYLGWWGDEVLVIYREKHRTIACALGPDGAPRMRAIDHDWRVVGDVVLYESEAHGLVERAVLPGLGRSAPLPRALAAERATAGRCDPGPPIAGSPAELRDRIAARLPAMPRATAELLIGALAYRFWDPWPPTVADYDAAYGQRRWNPPNWLPFDVHWAGSPGEREALLAALDAAAARPPDRCDPDDEAAELACRHIRARSHELAAACRAGRLPPGAYDSFWVEWSQAEFAAAEALFPAGMWAAWRALRPRARELDRLARRS